MESTTSVQTEKSLRLLDDLVTIFKGLDVQALLYMLF